MIATMEGFHEIAPGKLWRRVERPEGVDNFPFRVEFEHLDVVEAQAQNQIRTHQHDHYEVFVVESGVYEFRVNQHTGRIGRSGLLVVKPGDLHEDLCAGAAKFYALCFRMLPGPTPERSANLFAADADEQAQVIASSDVRPTLAEVMAILA